MQDIRFFLDSNVVLSGLLSHKGSPRIILDLLSIKAPSLIGITGTYNIEEIERNLKKKFPQLWPVYQDYFQKMNLEIAALPKASEIKPYLKKMSPKDVPVLVTARNAKAEYLVTGNKKDFPKAVMGDVKLVSPAEFLVELSRLIQEA